MATGEFLYGQPEALGLGPGATGAIVEALQGFLRRFGYLRLPNDSGPYAALRPTADEPLARDGVFDEATASAVRAFQRFFGLDETGTLDPTTVGLLSARRCGVPDFPYGPAAFGDAWPTPTLRYALGALTPDLPATATAAALAEAFRLWSSAAALTFSPVGQSANAEMVILFAAGAHGDGQDFDGIGGVLAHAFAPPPPSVALNGDVHFDEAETWTVALPNAPGATDLVTVAAHEIGHALGLAHSTDPGAIMFPTYSGPRRALGLDDIRRIQQLYGAVTPPPPVDPSQDPVVRRLIDEWILQQNRCVRRLHPGAYIDMWGRLCGRVNNTIIACNQSPDHPPDWDSHRYVWFHNWLPDYYPFTVRRYVELRLAGSSFGDLAQCR